MTDSELLKSLIRAKGYTLAYVAEKAGITRQSLTMKINNEREFDASEIQAVCDTLCITSLQLKDAVFFCH